MDARYVRPGSTAVVEGVAGRHRLWSTLVRRAAPTLATLVLATFVLAAPADAFVYWANSGTGTIGRANLDGTDVNQNFITGANAPAGVAVDGAHLYWTNFTGTGGSIGRANLDGTGVDQSFINTTAGVPGGGGNARLHGGPGRDLLRGGGGQDRLSGGRGSDRLFGGPGRDVLVGGPGRDLLVGGPGRDRLIGGSGRDELPPERTVARP